MLNEYDLQGQKPMNSASKFLHSQADSDAALGQVTQSVNNEDVDEARGTGHSSDRQGPDPDPR